MKNPVAKHARKFNKGGPMRDRKKAMKKGDRKHKGRYEEVSDKKDPKRAELYRKYREASARKDRTAMSKIAKTIDAYNKVHPTMPKNTTVEDKQQTDTSGRTNAAAKKPQDYTDPETGKRKTRMVPVHKDVQNEKLNPSDGIKAYIDDFQKSDAPQFQGKSKEKRKEMAIAAYLDAKRGAKKEDCWDGYKQVGMKKKGGKSVPNCVPEQTEIDELYYKVNVEGLPTMIVDADSPTEIKTNFRKLFKNPDKVVQEVERVSSAEVQKHFRLKSQGKSEVDEQKDVKELSVKTLNNYRRKASKPNPNDSAAKQDKRYAGVARAGQKLDKKLESTDAYGKSQAAIRAKKQRAGMSTSDQHKMGKVADMMRREREKRAAQNEDAEEKARLKLKHAREKENLKNRHSKEREAMKESMDPRDHTDKPGHVVVVTKPSGRKMIKHYHPQKAVAQKYADRVNKTNKVGHKATVHYTDGRKVHEEKDLQELSPATHKSYQQKAKKSVDKLQTKYTNAQIANRASKSSMNKLDKKIDRRHAGISKSMDKHEGVDRGFGSRMKAADAAANSYSKTKRKPENDTIRAIRAKHAAKKTVKESVIAEAMSKVMQDKVRALADKDGVKKMTAADLRKYKAMAKAELKKDKETKKAAPAKPVSKTSKGKVRTGSADPADRNIFMQLRKAQDRGGKQAITVTPTGKKVTLTPSQIGALLKRHDSIQKPVDKRKFKIMLIKTLRAKAK